MQAHVNCVVDSDLDKLSQDKYPGIKQVGRHVGLCVSFYWWIQAREQRKECLQKLWTSVQTHVNCVVDSDLEKLSKTSIQTLNM